MLLHPDIEDRFAMGRMPAGSAFSYGLCSECTDLAEWQLEFVYLLNKVLTSAPGYDRMEKNEFRSSSAG